MTAIEPDFDAARRAMVVSQLRPQGVTDKAVLAAMGSVAREEFVPERSKALAYMDRTLKADDGSPIMPPAELGILLTEAAPLPGEKALVIGGGGGYSAAVLEAIGLTVDRCDDLSGLPKKKYDLVLVEGAIEHVPDALAKKLKPEGRIAAAIVERGVPRLSVGAAGKSGLGFRSIADAQVPLLAGFEAPRPAFVF